MSDSPLNKKRKVARMDATEFLRFIWPDEGYYCIATQSPKGGYIHYPFPTKEEAAEKAGELDRKKQDVYYCMSSLAEEHVVNKATGKKSYRLKSNLHQLQVFFFELDVAKPGEWETLNEVKRSHRYEDRSEAVQALKDFCGMIGWPLPTLVSSGWGFHVYFPLTSPISTPEFESVGRMLKRAAKALKFKLDPGALDISRVFRVVGTHNYKRLDDPRPVEIVKLSGRHDASTLRLALEHAAEKYGLQKEPEKDALGDIFGESNLQTYDDTPIDFTGLLQCGAIRSVQDNGGDVPYYHWWHAGQVVRFAIDGRQKFHAMSSGSKDYDYDETEQILDRFENNGVGPTLCSTFREHVHQCDECQYLGKIKSPIVLGRANLPSDPPQYQSATLDADDPVAVEIPNPPTPYKRSNGKVFREMTDKEGGSYDEIVCSYDLYPIRRAFFESQEKEYLVWNVMLPLEGDRELLIQASDIYDKRSFASALVNSGIYVEHKQLDLLRDYMVAYIRTLQETAKRDYMLARLGWRDDNSRFVIGSKIFSADKVENCQIEKSSRLAIAIRSHGTLDAWKEVLDMYNKPEFAAHQFALATAFGSPLMAFTGVSGGIINMLGVSGEGKSSIQRLVNSVYGHPLELMLPAEKSSATYHARMQYVTTMGNLPVCAEEITNIEPKELGTLAYSISSGAEKWTLTQDRKLRATMGMFCLVMLSSSNSSLIEKLSSVEGATAKSLRIIEMRLPMVRTYSKTMFQEAFDSKLMDNYGLAGEVYIRFLVEHLQDAKDLVKALITKIDKELNVPQEERYWTAIAAANIAGLIIAKECGLHNMDTKLAYRYALEAIDLMRGHTQDVKQTAAEAMAEFMNENMQGIIVVEEAAPGARSSTKTMVKPTRAIIGRYDMRSGLTWVSASAFKVWCVKHGRMFKETVTELLEQKVLVHTDSPLRVLGAGTEYKTGQIKCLIVDTNARAFSGGADLSVVSRADDVVRESKKSKADLGLVK